MDLIRNAPAKPARGSGILAREQKRKDADAVEREAKAIAKARDNWTCRWPEKHKCRGVLEAAHIVDASRGGPMHPRNLVSLCAFLHRRGPESIHGKQLRVECETESGANWTLSFWRQGEDGEYFLVAREIRPGVVERD